MCCREPTARQTKISVAIARAGQLRSPSPVRRKRDLDAAGFRRQGRFELARDRDREHPVRRALYRQSGDRSRQHWIGPGPASRRFGGSERGRGKDAGAVVQHECVLAPCTLHVRQLGEEHGAGAGLCRRRPQRPEEHRSLRQARGSSFGGRYSIFSTAPTSTCQAASPSRRTLAASLARSPRGRCSSA
jgi:hypothetical protein